MNDFFSALKLVSFSIHKEGYRFILIFALITALLALMSNFLGTFGLVATLWGIFICRCFSFWISEVEDAP